MLTVLPDATRLVCDFLRAAPEVTAVVADRVFTELPADKTFPLVLVRRILSTPLATRPWWAETVTLDVNVYGGRTTEAHQLAQVIRSLMAGQLSGNHPQGTVCGVTVLSMVDAPDPDVPPLSDGRPRRRVVCSVAVTVHPVPEARAS